MKTNFYAAAAVTLAATLLFSACGNSKTPTEAETTEPVETVESATASEMPETYFDIPKEAELSDDDDINFLEQHQIPALERMPEDTANELLSDLQIFRRLALIGFDENAFSYPEKEWKTIYQDVSEEMKTAFAGEFTAVDCDAKTASELNACLQEYEDTPVIISVTSDAVTVDEVISLRSNTFLDLGSAVLTPAEGVDLQDYIIFLDTLENVGITGGVITGGAEHGIFVVDSKNVLLSECDIREQGKKGVAMMGDNEYFILRNLTIRENWLGGLFIDGNAAHGIIDHCDISNNKGAINFAAGVSLASIPVIDKYSTQNLWLDVPLDERLDAPTNLVLLHNNISDNVSMGVLSESASNNYFIGNTINGNDKEGLCLDEGSFGNYLRDNEINGNGWRNRQTDEDLVRDFVDQYGRMEDGSSVSKVPGVSLDNTIYNILFHNTISENYGSGLKTVRSVYRNVILENTISDNNRGASDTFHYFGIELGFAAEPDFEGVGLDFVPPCENVLCDNTVTGAHYAGIFLAEGDCYNDIYGNTASGATAFAFEDHSQANNNVHDNAWDGDVLVVD